MTELNYPSTARGLVNCHRGHGRKFVPTRLTFDEAKSDFNLGFRVLVSAVTVVRTASLAVEVLQFVPRREVSLLHQILDGFPYAR